MLLQPSMCTAQIYDFVGFLLSTQEHPGSARGAVRSWWCDMRNKVSHVLLPFVVSISLLSVKSNPPTRPRHLHFVTEPVRKSRNLYHVEFYLQTDEAIIPLIIHIQYGVCQHRATPHSANVMTLTLSYDLQCLSFRYTGPAQQLYCSS